MCLKNKWALVTGSSRGIGQKIAIGLAEIGCNLFIHGRKKQNIEKTQRLLQNYDIEVIPVAGDLNSEEDTKILIDNILSLKSGIDILYNNAAIQNVWKEIWDIDLSEWNKVFRVNLYSIIQLNNAFIPEMKKRGYGRIINLSSGIKDVPQLSPYSVSKAAIDKYTKDLAAELAGSNVLINFLDPGWLKTDMGGENAMFDVETVLPGALVPVLLKDDGPSGELFRAQDYKYLKI